MTKRTAQDILAERRATVLELARERDPVARELLQFSIDQIDRELHAASERAAEVVLSTAEGPSKPRQYDEVIAEARRSIAEFNQQRNAS